jgi:fucose permease
LYNGPARPAATPAPCSGPEHAAWRAAGRLWYDGARQAGRVQMSGERGRGAFVATLTNDPAARAAGPRPASERRQIGLGFFAFIMIGANDGGGGVLLPSQQAFYHVDKATIGLLFLAATLGYLVAAFTSGLLTERLGQRAFLMLGAAGFLAAALALSLAPPFAALLGLLFLLGFGVAALDAGLNAYFAGLPRNTTVLNYLHAFYGLGALLGPLVASGVLAAGGGWNVVYLVWAALAVVTLAGSARIIPRAPRVEAPAGAPRERNVLAQALRLPAVRWAAAFLLVYVGAEVVIGAWSFSLLTEERGQSTLLAGWAVSGYWMGLTVGRLALGRVAARVGNRRLIEGCLIGVAGGLLLLWLAPGGLTSAAGLWLTGFSLGPIFPTTIALLSTRVAARLLPSAIGFLASAGSAGAALFPWLAGAIAQRWGLGALLPGVIALAVVMFAIWPALQTGRPAPDAAPAA